MKAMLDFFNGNRVFFYANLAVAFLLLNAISAGSGCRLDLTRDRVHSLSDSTEQVLSRVEQSILIEAYISEDAPPELHSGIRPIVNVLEAIGRVGGDRVKLLMIDPSTEERRQQAERRGIQGLQISEQEEAGEKVRLYYFGVYLKVGEKEERIPLVDNYFVSDFEYRFLRAVKQMTRKDERSGIGYAVVDGAAATQRWTRPDDQNKDNFYGFRTLLEEERGRVEDVTLEERVPASVETLVLAGLPQLNARQQYELDQFLLRGGNLVLLLKGFDFQMQQPNPQMAALGLGGSAGFGFATTPQDELQKLNDWLGKYGVLVQPGVIFEPELGLPTMDVFGQFVRRVSYPAWAVYSRDTDNLQGDVAALAPITQLVLPWFSTLDLREATQPNVKFQALIVTTPGAIRKENASLDYLDAAKVGTQPDDARLGRAEPVAVLASGRFQSAFRRESLPEGADPALFRESQAGATESKVLVVGTPYLVSDVLFRNETGAAVFGLNRAFLLNLMESIQGDADLAAARARVRTVSRLGPAFTQSAFLQFIYTWFHILAIPAGLAIYGIARLSGRNRRRGIESEGEQ